MNLKVAALMGSFLAADLQRKWPNKSLILTKRADWSHTKTRGARLRRSEYLLTNSRTILARHPDIQELWPNSYVVLFQKQQPAPSFVQSCL